MLRAAIGFEHCVKNVVDTWMAQSGWAITRHPLFPTYGKGLIVNNDGWLTVPEGIAPGSESYAHIDLRPLLDNSGRATAIAFGYRAKLVKPAVAGLGNLCLWGSNPSTTGTHALATFANLFPAGSPEGTECLVEIVLDLVSTYRYTYVNGVMLGSAIYNGLSTALIKTGDFGIYWSPCPANTAGYVAIRDIWVTDDLPGDGMSGRLGDMKVRPLTLTSAVGNGWAASDGGSLLAALTAPTDKVNPALVESSLGAGTLDLKFSSALPNNDAVQAIQLILNAKGSSNNAAADVSMERNGIVSPKRRTQLDLALKGRSMRTWPLAPDGSRWSNANLAETTIKITPE
jgi:hypothetical protein